MATFPSAEAALNAAARMQRQIAAHPRLRVDDQPVSIRIGCHYGVGVAGSCDIPGSAVHTANRITSQARAGQILVTEAAASQLPAQWRAACRPIDTATALYPGNESPVYEALWRAGGGTRGTGRDALPFTRMRLWRADIERLVDERRPIVTRGRSGENDLAVEWDSVSRQHARIELSRDGFLLFDHSTNGTFVLSSYGEKFFAHRNSMRLPSGGAIGLGRIPADESAHTIRFLCEPTRDREDLE